MWMIRGRRSRLLAALKDEDPTVRVSAIHALGKDPSAEVVPRLLGLFRDPEHRA